MHENNTQDPPNISKVSQIYSKASQKRLLKKEVEKSCAFFLVFCYLRCSRKSVFNLDSKKLDSSRKDKWKSGSKWMNNELNLFSSCCCFSCCFLLVPFQRHLTFQTRPWILLRLLATFLLLMLYSLTCLLPSSITLSTIPLTDVAFYGTVLSSNSWY